MQIKPITPKRVKESEPVTTLTVDLKAISHNLSVLRAETGGNTKILAVVKADSYGLGMVPLSQHLWEQGLKTFMVARIQEGIELRIHLPQAEIGVFDGLGDADTETYLHHDLMPVLNRLEHIERWKAEASTSPAMIFLDTGMNRLGLGVDDQRDLVSKKSILKNLNIHSYHSHFIASNVADSPLNETQYQRFQDILSQLPQAPWCLSNSNGVFLDKKYHGHMIRVGRALYGLQIECKNVLAIKPAVSMHARVLQRQLVRQGESIGYMASHRLDKDRWVATLAIGFADGFDWRLSGKGQVYFDTHPAPILGRVSMDYTTVDVTDLASSLTDVGKEAEIFGAHQSVSTIAQAHGLLDYEILTGLSKRAKPVYIH